MVKHLPKKSLFSALFIMAGLLLGASKSFAATITSTTNGGTWSATTTWTGGVVPGSNDDVIISGSAVTLSAAGNARSLTVNSGGVLIVNAALAITNSYSVTVNGTLQFNATGTLTGGSGGPNGVALTVGSGATLITANADGLYTNTNGNGSGSIVLNKGNKSFTFDPVVNYTFNGAAQTISNGLPTTINNLTLSGSGIKTVPATLNVTGNISMSGTASVTAGTIVLNGSAAQSVSGTASFNNLNVSNTSLAGVTLSGSASVAGTLTLTSGLLKVNAGNTLTLTTGGTVAGSSFGATKHIATLVNTSTGAKGVLQVNGVSGSYTFPVGNGTYYLPATVTPTGSANFSVTAFTGVTTNGQPNGNPTSKTMWVNAVWDVTNVSGNGTPTTLSFGWPASLERSDFASYASDGNIGITHYNGTKWDDLRGSGDGNDQTATRSGLTSFSPFMVGLIQADITLPVRFTDIKAAQVSAGTQISWSNATEENVQEYVVERSTDGRNYTALSTVAAGMNNNAKATYDVLDQTSLRTETYYRIKAVEHNGKATYSAVVKVSAAGAGTSINIFPNPVTGNQISFTASNLPEGKYSLNIYTAAGQLLSARVLNHKGGFISQTLGLNGAKAGQYVLEVNGAVRTYKHLVIQ